MKRNIVGLALILILYVLSIIKNKKLENRQPCKQLTFQDFFLKQRNDW